MSSADLTPMERLVLKYAADGEGAFETAYALSRGMETVNFHRKGARRKLPRSELHLREALRPRNVT